MIDPVRHVIELSRTDPEVRSRIRGGGLRYSAAQLASIEADRSTRKALELAAYHLNIRAEVELHGVPESVDNFGDEA